jgi:hypothetical protein
LKDIKVRLYAAPNSAEFFHDLRYSQTWEYEWTSKVFWGDKKLGYVGDHRILNPQNTFVMYNGKHNYYLPRENHMSVYKNSRFKCSIELQKHYSSMENG